MDLAGPEGRIAMGRDDVVSVVAAIQNDGLILPSFVAEVSEVLDAHWDNHEIVLVDAYSTDETPGVVERLLERHPHLRLIRLSRRYGRAVTVTAGLDAAIGDYVVVLRPQSDPPGEIPAMVRVAKKSGHGIVLGTSEREKGRGPIARACRRAFFWLTRRVLHSPLPPDATGFCVLSRTVVNAITRIKSQYRHLGFLSCTVGHAVTCYPYRQIARTSKKSHRPLREMIDEGIALLVTNTLFPLRLVSYLGAFAGLLNLVYVVYIVLVNIFKGRVAEGWTTLSLQMSSMFFFVFLNLVIISEYIAHIMQESQDRPLYNVLDEQCGTGQLIDPERRNVDGTIPLRIREG
jgi:glycosyltransferase involved in cell wall biosynthesis